MAVLIQRWSGAATATASTPPLGRRARRTTTTRFGDQQRRGGVAAGRPRARARPSSRAAAALRFSPGAPAACCRSFSTPKDLLRNSQRGFFALDLRAPRTSTAGRRVDAGLDAVEARTAASPWRRRVALDLLAATTTRPRRPGAGRAARLVTFAPHPQRGALPAAPGARSALLELRRGAWAARSRSSSPADLAPADARAALLYVLQMRPQARAAARGPVELGDVTPDERPRAAPTAPSATASRGHARHRRTSTRADLGRRGTPGGRRRGRAAQRRAARRGQALPARRPGALGLADPGSASR